MGKSGACFVGAATSSFILSFYGINILCVVDKFVSDRTWKQANSYSIGKELVYATSDSTSLDQKRRLKYLTEYWGALPNFWQDGGRGWMSGLTSNLSKGIVDPTNIIAPGIGSQVIKQVAKTGGKYALTKAVAAAPSKAACTSVICVNR